MSTSRTKTRPRGSEDEPETGKGKETPNGAPGVAAAASKAAKVIRKPPEAYGTPTGLKGYVLVHFCKLTPHGSIIGQTIPTTKALAVKMAVIDVIMPEIDSLKEPSLQTAIKKAVRSNKWDKALEDWSAYMQRVGLSRKLSNEYAESLQIRELSIVEEP